MTTKSKIKSAFSKLRREGWFCRMNFWCCQSCGWAAVPKGKENVLFYHAQDAEAFGDRWDKEVLTKDLYIAHSGNTARAVEVLRENGLTVEWGGTENTRIVVKKD